MIRDRTCIKCGVCVDEGHGRELSFKRTRENKIWEVNVLLCDKCTIGFEERLKKFVKE